MGVFDCDGSVVGEDMQKGDGVVGHLVGAGIDDLDDAVGSLAAAERQRNDGVYAPHTVGLASLQAGVVFGVCDDEGLAVLGDPAGGAFADLDSNAAEGFLLAAGREGVVKLPAERSSMSRVQRSASMMRSMCSRMVRRMVSRSKLDVSERAS